MLFQVQIAGHLHAIELQRNPQSGAEGWEVRIDGQQVEADIRAAGPGTLSILAAGRSFTLRSQRLERTAQAAEIWLGGAGTEWSAEVREPRRLAAARRAEQSGPVRLKAPMAGKVVRLLVAVGAAVEAGQGIVVLEAMKMQNEVRSPKSGTLTALPVAAGATVATGQLLAEIE